MSLECSGYDVAYTVGLSVLDSIPTFSGFEDEQAKRFIMDFEEALDLLSISSDKFKKFNFKMKLRGLPSEWYETIRDDEEYKKWECVKVAFLEQFNHKKLKPKDVLMRLMNIKQSVEEKESIQSLSIRITHLFNDYKQIMKICLKEQEKVEYFIESLFPSYKEKLNNQYQSADAVSYINCTFNDVLATALKLERNARVFEEDIKKFTSGVSQLQINAVHKAVNSTTELEEKEVKFNKIAEEDTFEIEIQNAQDIKKIQKEQVIMKDQLEAVTTALQNLGDEMKLMRLSIENLRYESVDCPDTINPRYNHCSNPPFKHTDSRNFNNYSFAKRYDDPRLYNAPRTNDGRLQGSCYKCGGKGHYGNACRAQISNEGHMGQREIITNAVYQPAQSELLQFDSLSEDESNQLPTVDNNFQENVLKDLRVSSGLNRSQEIRSMSPANTNQVSDILKMQNEIEEEKKKFKKPFKESIENPLDIDVGRFVLKLKRYEKKRKKKQEAKRY